MAWAGQYGVWRVCEQVVGASDGEEERLLLLDEHADSDQGD